MNKIYQKLSMAALSAAMVAAPAINVFAAPEDIIDTSKKATLTIHKYDITAAQADGVIPKDNPEKAFKTDGTKDADAEKKLEDYKIKGVQFSYQKVGDICTETVAGKIQVMYVIPPELQTILGLTTTRDDNKYTSDEINDALKTALADNTVTKNKLEDYIRGGHGTTSMPLTDEDGVSQATNLPLGLYLIVETEVPANVHTTVDPFFVSLPMTDLQGTHWFYDVDVYPKNQTNIPTLDKLVRQQDDAVDHNKPEYLDSTTVSEEEIANYIIISKLPQMTSKATYLTQYTFTDKIDCGVEYQKNATMYFYDNEADAKANNKENAVFIWDAASGNFKQDYTTAAAAKGTSTAVFSMTEKGLAALNKQKAGVQYSEYSNLYMVISYDAKLLNSDNAILGDSGNTNNVTLEWKRTNMADFDTLKARARIYTYGIDLKKTFKSGANAQAGDATKVKFSLRNKTDDYYVNAIQKTPGSGIYYVTGSDNKKTDEANGTQFSPAADGTLIINGLEADEYVMTELETSPGYTLLKEPITIKINSTKDDFVPSNTTLYDTKDKAANQAAGHTDVIETNVNKASATVDGNKTNMKADGTSTNARVEMAVTNTPGFKLPMTGGAGTIAFTVAGCTVAFAGIAVATKKSKKHDNDEK